MAFKFNPITGSLDKTVSGITNPNDSVTLKHSGTPVFQTITNGVNIPLKFLHGLTNARLVGNVECVHQLEGTGGATGLSITRNSSTTTHAPRLIFGKSAGSSTNSNAAVSENHVLGEIRFSGADGTDLTNYSASIVGLVDDDVDTNEVPGRLEFRTGTTTDPTVKMTIDKDGNCGIGTSDPKWKVHISSDEDLTDFKSTSKGALCIENSDYQSGDYNAIDFTFPTYEHPLARIGAKITSTGTLLSFGTSNAYADGVTNEALIIDKDGKCGIGTTNPSALLHVNSQLTNTCATFESTDAGAVINIKDNGARSSIEQSGTDLKIIADTDASDAGNDSKIKFQVDASTKMTINKDGNCGIGTVDPSSAKLQIHGTGLNSQLLRLVNTSHDSGLNSAQLKFGVTNSGGERNCRIEAVEHENIGHGIALDFYTNDANSTDGETRRMRIGANGNVGIAKENPQAKLDVDGSAIFRSTLAFFDDTLAADSSSGTENRIKIGNNGDLQLFHDGRTGKNNSVLRSLSGDLQINSGNSAGNVQINLNENVAGETKELSAEFIKNGGVKLYHNGLGPKLETDSTGVFIDGKLLLGKTSDDFAVAGVAIRPAGEMTLTRGGDLLTTRRITTEGVHVSLRNISGTQVGTITTSSTNTAFNTEGSDRALKKNFENWSEDVLNLFKNINPQKFNFIHQNDGDDKTKGFVAQDMVGSFPEAYTKGEEDDAKYYFNPSGMVVYLMKAIQELQAKVEVLEAA